MACVLSTVYVPAPGAMEVADITRGAAIVGELQDDGGLLVDFEGNVYGAPNLERYANRVLKAAGRQQQRFPTRARRIVAAESMIAIGEYDSREQVVRVTGPDSERLLARWLDRETLDHDELIARR
jgi:hypothetical protein